MKTPEKTAGIRIAIACARYNEAICDRLLQGARDCMNHHGIVADNRIELRVPGAWELQIAADQLTRQVPAWDAVIALGALIRGETPHFDVLANGVAGGLSRLTIDRGIPIIFGVVTTDTVDQAIARSAPDESNKGWEAVLAALETVELGRRLGRT